MAKRKDEMGEHIKSSKRIKCPKKNYVLAPPRIESLSDLVRMGKSLVQYPNLDMSMLWRITPYIEELNDLIGMKSFKETVFIQILYYIQGLHLACEDEYLHTLMLGPPGVGKTTAAKLLGKIYRSMSILNKDGSFKIAHRDDFVAGYLGQTAIKTQKLLESCIGGVLFIDEVYSLGPRSEDRDSFSDEALDTLTSFLSEHKQDFCCIAAGYEEDIITRLFSKNIGLQRRFPWIHRIEQYSTNELMLIFLRMLEQQCWDTNANHTVIEDILSVNPAYFQYAGGDIDTFLTKCKMAHAKRLINEPDQIKYLLTETDLREGFILFEKTNGRKDESNTTMHSYMYN